MIIWDLDPPKPVVQEDTSRVLDSEKRGNLLLKQRAVIQDIILYRLWWNVKIWDPKQWQKIEITFKKLFSTKTKQTVTIIEIWFHLIIRVFMLYTCLRRKFRLYLNIVRNNHFFIGKTQLTFLGTIMLVWLVFRLWMGFRNFVQCCCIS